MNKPSMEAILKALLDVTNYAERNRCSHEETHREGAIWEVCDACGAKWADDEGGKPPYVEPTPLVTAYATIDALRDLIKQSPGKAPARLTREQRTDEFITDCLLDDYHTLSTGEPPRMQEDRDYQHKVRKALKRVLHYYGVNNIDE